ncbi:MAG TPA: hypothetical protein VFY39_10125 [Gammaproteobacteria bacterium]|nr:hypothetical protein [Gammaproteobacteria bacterium]
MNKYFTDRSAFEAAIRRGAGHFRSSELDAAVSAIKKYVDRPSAENIKRVRDCLAAWKTRNPKEFQNRGAPIEDDLRAQLYRLLDQWKVPKQAAGGTGAINVKQWMEQRRAGIETLSTYACSDLTHGQPKTYNPKSGAEPDWNRGFAKLAVPSKRAEIWKRYTTAKAHPTQIVVPRGREWLSWLYKGNYTSVTRGRCGVCTTFAQSAAHLLTSGIEHGPRVEIVSWGDSSTGHVFVLVNRQGGYQANNRVPDDWKQESNVVVVDAWLGSLGCPPIAFGGPNYRSGMVQGLICCGEKPAW